MSPHLIFPILSEVAPIEQPPEAPDVGVVCKAALSSQLPTQVLSVSQQDLWVYFPPSSWLPLLFHSHSPISDPCLSPRLVQKPPSCLLPTIFANALQLFKLPGHCLSNTSKNPIAIPFLYAKLRPKSSICHSYNLTPDTLLISQICDVLCSGRLLSSGCPFSSSHRAFPCHLLHEAYLPLWLLLGAYLTHGRCRDKTTIEMCFLQSLYLLHFLDCFTL